MPVRQVPLPTVAGDLKDIIPALSSVLENLDLTQSSNEVVSLSFELTCAP